MEPNSPNDICLALQAAMLHRGGSAEMVQLLIDRRAAGYGAVGMFFVALPFLFLVREMLMF